jgi:hypothetical protein
MVIRPCVLVGFAVVLLLTACGDEGPGAGQPGGAGTGAGTQGGAVPPPPAGEAVLQITTQIGEQCPHLPITPDPRCDPKPRPDTAFAVRSEKGDLVREGRSGADGRATVLIDPGIYVVRGEPVAGYQFTPERRVTVSAGTTVAVPLTYTIGIQ